MCERERDCYTCRNFDWVLTLEENKAEILENDKWPDDVVCSVESIDEPWSYVSSASAIICDEYKQLTAAEEWHRTIKAAQILYGGLSKKESQQ
jgi:hypothetical protein